MRKHTSLYLDALRILAALAVFFSHITRESLSAGNPVIRFLGQFGQEGVAIFFVISGMVIAYVARERDHDFRSYLVARLGRLWSVIFPALILTVVLDTVGRLITPEMYPSPPLNLWQWNFSSAWNFIGPLFFLNQVTFATADPGTNGPFWSLCYEFWYYILFGIAYYLRGIPRLLLLVLTAAIAGEKILGLFPIWAFGLVVYVYLKNSSRNLSVAIWGLSCVALLALMLLKYKISVLFAHNFPAINADSGYIALWISHFAVGIACAVNIAFYDLCGGSRLLEGSAVERCIRFLAARSFSLYLYQAPCLFFYGALTYGMHSSVLRILLVILLSLATIFLLAELTEKKKGRFATIVDDMIPISVFPLTAMKRIEIAEEEDLPLK